jgi:NAD(P)-dependent dehydrogenase (short-subunit alcohol dehydrogenase family)
VNATADRHDGIDVLYNHAGALRAAPIAEMSDEDWHATIRNELDIVFFPTRAAWPHLVRRGGGSIVNISSMAAMRGLEYGGYVAHCAAKGGVVSMTRQMAMEGAPHFIRANSISPGPVLAPSLEEHAGMAELRRGVSGWTILPRLGSGEDTYGGLYLASDESLWLTGHNLVIDGGMGVKSGFTEHAGNRMV